MRCQSPVAMRSSAELKRMEALIKATGITTPITVSPFPPVQLDVQACYNQLSHPKEQRPEDIVMRQALELYCSLISPPTTPTEAYKSGYQSEQDHLPVTPSGIFQCQDDYRQPSIVYDEPKECDFDPATDPNRPFGFASGHNFLTHHNYLSHQSHQTHYSWSTPSTVSDHENSDVDEDDDPFACYPSSHPLRRSQKSAGNSQVNLTQYGRSSFEPSLHKVSHSNSSQDRIQFSAPHFLGPRNGSSTDVRSPGSTAPSVARRSFFSPPEQSNASDPKRAGRKRSFSVVSFVKHRKAPSIHAGSLRISGPTPIDTTSHSASTSSGTFSIPVRTSQSSGARLSLVAGCLSPALEINEDISPVKPASSRPIPSRNNSRAATPQDEESNPMTLARKYSSRPETKSLWRTIKSTSSRSSLNVERPFIPHLHH